jgi:hypothetical protein
MERFKVNTFNDPILALSSFITNDTYLGNMITTTAASDVRISVIAIPIYPLKDDSTLVGVWSEGIDFGV